MSPLERYYPKAVECTKCRGYGYTVRSMANVGLPGEHYRVLCESCEGGGTRFWRHMGARIWPTFWVVCGNEDETFDYLADAMEWIEQRPGPEPPDEPDEDDLIEYKHGSRP